MKTLISTPTGQADEYESFYRAFDSKLMRQIRMEAYGEDIGQHSWVSAAELRADALRLGLDKTSHVLDLGCGPCGPLTFLISQTGCRGVGFELSPSAIQVGQARAEAMQIEKRFSARVADLNEPLPIESRSVDAVLAIDVVLHLLDRSTLFNEVERILRPGGRFLFTDAGIVSGAITNDEIRLRSAHGYTQFVPMGWNEELLGGAGFRVLETEDRTESVIRNARGRLRALANHREELIRVDGDASYENQIGYVTTVASLAARHALTRFMYLGEKLVATAY